MHLGKLTSNCLKQYTLKLSSLSVFYTLAEIKREQFKRECTQNIKNLDHILIKRIYFIINKIMS